MAIVFIHHAVFFSGSNLDKCDVFSESDPFFTVSKVNPDGSDTIIYRSDYIKVKKLVYLNVIVTNIKFETPCNQNVFLPFFIFSI